MSVTEAGVRGGPARPGAPPGTPRRRPTGALILALGLLGVHQALRFSGLSAGGLQADLGIQYHLAELTAQGAVPHVDFQHGWNSGSFYLGALLYRLVAGNAALWIYLFEVVTAAVVGGVALLMTGWRLRFPGVWLLTLLVSWLWLTHVPNGKYAIPLLWFASLAPVGVLERRVPAIVVRVVLGAVTFWLHVELAVLLAAGVAMYDLFGAPGGDLRQRATRAAAAPVAIAAAFALQLLVYQLAAGVPPAELIGLMVGAPTEVFDEAHFGYPLFNPGSFRSLVYPVSLVLPFAPMVWRRLSAPTRMAAFLHLSTALIAIRRTDEGHVAAASTMLVVVAVLAAWDLCRAGRLTLPTAGGYARHAGMAAAGVLWLTAAITAGFRIPSLFAVVALTATVLVGVAVANRTEAPWAGVGALAAAGVLVLAGLGGRTVVELHDDQSGERAETIAAAIAPAVDACADGTGRAWVVPEPLGLYQELGLTNPTPHYAFWYDFAGKREAVVDAMDAGEIPLIIQPYAWPVSMEGMVDDIERRYDVCDQILVGEEGPLVTLWSYR